MEAVKFWLRHLVKIESVIMSISFSPRRLPQWCQIGLWLFVWGFGVPLTGEAEEPGARLQTFLKEIKSLQAEFHQTLLDEHREPLEESRGLFLLQRPGKFRWDYQEPFSQEIVADGKHIWFYDPDLEQVTVKEQAAALGDTPALLLSGERLPKDSFHINNLPTKKGLAWVELLPRDKEATFERLLLGFDDHSLRLMELRDSFGQTTRLVFTAVKINISLDPARFIFTPPEGVDVIGSGSS
jgi:outer membrane lipoprotein carrier protein